MGAAGHDGRVDAWIARLGGGDRQFFARTGIPLHVAWRLSTVVDVTAMTFLDFVVSDGALPNSVTGRVVIIARRLFVDVEFTDSVEGDLDAASGRLTVRSGAAVDSIELGGSDGAHATGSSREPGMITVRFREGARIGLPLGQWARDTGGLMAAVRTAAGWPDPSRRAAAVPRLPATSCAANETRCVLLDGLSLVTQGCRCGHAWLKRRHLAKRTLVELIDDLCGGPAERTVTYSVDGKTVRPWRTADPADAAGT